MCLSLSMRNRWLLEANVHVVTRGWMNRSRGQFKVVQFWVDWADSEGWEIMVFLRNLENLRHSIECLVSAVRRVFCAFGLKRRPTNRRNANSANMTSQYFELFVYRN